jgi:hypothetical protein
MGRDILRVEIIRVVSGHVARDAGGRCAAVVECCLLALLAACTPRQADVTAPVPESRGWQYQLQGRVDTGVNATTFIVDGFDVDEATVADLRSRGRTVICYVNAGALESWRPDAGRFPDEIVGDDLDDWQGERWLDIRRIDVLQPILAERFDMCRRKGFAGVEADNVDGYTQESGFELTGDDQLRFNRMLAALAHERSLTIGLKNDLDQIDDLVDEFDFAVNESCVQYRECAALAPFTAQGKAVLHVEYELPTADFCPVTVPLGFRSIRKPVELTAPVEQCPAPS